MSKTKEIKQTTAVQQLREIRDKIGLDIRDMDFEELKKYIEERLTLNPESWGKPSDLLK